MSVLRRFARYFYVPTMMIGFNALAIYLIASGYRYVWIGLVILAGIGLSFAMEHVLPYEDAWNEAHGDTAKDIAHGIVYEAANLFTLVVFLIISAMLLPEWSLWPRELPIAVQFLLAVVVVDCTMTIVHYFSHRVDWLWRLHAVQHSNVDYALGPFQRILAIGPVHRLHHVNWAGEGDVNFGLFLTVWDRLLGTFKLPHGRTPTVGDIGIQDCPHYPQDYRMQLRAPFDPDGFCPQVSEDSLQLSNSVMPGRSAGHARVSPANE
jgi:sterol desaturase/sphingolipid hydroxylase (fatty acid hydroxylase superfamily)